jgi:hypothetical protein
MRCLRENWMLLIHAVSKMMRVRDMSPVPLCILPMRLPLTSMTLVRVTLFLQQGPTIARAAAHFAPTPPHLLVQSRQILDFVP